MRSEYTQGDIMARKDPFTGTLIGLQKSGSSLIVSMNITHGQFSANPALLQNAATLQIPSGAVQKKFLNDLQEGLTLNQITGQEDIRGLKRKLILVLE